MVALMTPGNLGQRTKTTRLLTSSERAFAAMREPAGAILDGGESRKYGPEPNPYFISMCLAQSPNRHTQAFPGCAFSANTSEMEFISGRSMGGRHRLANRQSLRFIRHCGATASHAMAVTPISRMPTPPRNGFAGATWMAVSNVS
jgi:hypothetical protein